MKVLYLDVNPLGTSVCEDYSFDNPRRYGGGSVFARWMRKMNPNGFNIIAHSKCFENMSESNGCIVWDEGAQEKVLAGEPIVNLIPNAESYDLFLTHNPAVYLNLEGLKTKQAAWCVGYLDTVHPKQEHLFLYNEFQHPKILNPNTKSHKITIGKLLPEFKEYEKEDYIFQCSRQCALFSSSLIARFCIENKIRGVFAGPLDKDCDLMSYIDNKTTFYLGQISEEEKIDYTKRARLYTLLHNWPTPFSLSAVEALSFGTPVACVKTGFWPSLIKHSVNGFFVGSEQALLAAYECAQHVSQFDCWLSAAPFSVPNMVESVLNACRKVINE